MRAAIDFDDGRISLRRIEIGRLQDGVVERLAILGLQRAKLGLGMGIEIGGVRVVRIERIFLDPCDELTTGRVETSLRRLVRRR